MYHIVGGKNYVKENGCYYVSLRREDTNLVEDWNVPAKIQEVELDVGMLETILQGPFQDNVGPYGEIKMDWKGPWGREFLHKYGKHVRAIRRSTSL